MYKKIEPYLEGIDIFDRLGERKSELSNTDLGYIGGIIKERKPKKIVEIGVSAGGTTCFIMRTLEKLSLNSKVYSVDISRDYHLNPEKKCGYQIKEAENILSNIHNHTLMLKKNISEVIDGEIGSEIDMLILDTIHYLPGELLDFLVCYPYLTEDAAVVLDDLTFAHFGENTNAVATKTLFDLVVADKYLPKDGGIYPKMAGFVLNCDTPKYIKDTWGGVLSPWWYKLSEREIASYRAVIKKKYNFNVCEIFDEAVNVNNRTVEKKEDVKNQINKILKMCEENKKILVYGAGRRGTALVRFLEDRGMEIEGYIISDDRDKGMFKGIRGKMFHLREVVERRNEYNILLAAANDDIRNNLAEVGMEYYDIPNYVFPFIKEYASLLC